jgi:hypothetical protein
MPTKQMTKYALQRQKLWKAHKQLISPNKKSGCNHIASTFFDYTVVLKIQLSLNPQ